MATTLSTVAMESSTYVVTMSFTDENGDAVVPNSVTWTLTDEDGTVINDREDVVVAPASSISIVLSGEDLDPGDDLLTFLLLTVSAEYDSDLGVGLPLVEQVRIPIEGLEP